MYAVFKDNMSGHRISTSISDNKKGYVYHIVAWDSIWDRHIIKNDLQNAVPNPNGEKIKAVYYYQANGSGEILESHNNHIDTIAAGSLPSQPPFCKRFFL